MLKEKIKFTEPHILTGMPKSAPILVALSGGADSSALLHLLVGYGRRTGCKIAAAHLNHGIRGEEYGFEADRDERFCSELCDSLDVPLFVKKLDIPALASESRRSLETEAREARYAFFAEVMREQDISILATAHNSDDNIETQLFNLCRGCGIDGLVGIPATRALLGVEGGVVIRPILCAEKTDIIAYCEENSIGFVTDSTNLETDCTRNEIRHKLIPVLAEIFPAAQKSAQKLSEYAAEDSEFILMEAKRFLGAHPRLEVKELSALHVSLLKRVLILAFEAVSDVTLESVHLDSMISLLRNTKNGAAVSLPDKKQAALTDGSLIFREEQREIGKETVLYCQKLDLKLNIIENTKFAVLITNSGENNAQDPDGYTLYASASLKADTAAPLYAKNRAQGASVLDGGVNKRIKKLMCDKKVPLYDRDTLPIIYSGESALYVPLCAISDTAKTRRGEKGNINIYVYKKTSEA